MVRRRRGRQHDDRKGVARVHKTGTRGFLRSDVEARASAGIGKAKGYKGSYLLRRNLGTEVEFITILLWNSLDDLRSAAGHADYETAIIPEERRKFLAHFDAKAAHYELASVHGIPF